MSDDLFGFVDANVPRSLTPPEGYEDVHRPGNSWARQGDRLSNTSWLTPAQWNHLIAQFRGLTTIEGIDLSDVEQSSPLLLREALLRAIAAILAGEDIGSFGLMEKAVYDPQGIGDDAFDRANHTGTQSISSIAGLENALNDKVESSDVEDAVTNAPAVPKAMGTSTADWNTFTAPGWVGVVVQGTASNGPGDAGYYYVLVCRFQDTPFNVMQYAFPQNVGARVYARYRNTSGVWSAWERIAARADESLLLTELANQVVTVPKRFRSTGAMASAVSGNASLEVYASPAAGNGAFLAFHRQGTSFSCLGVDVDGLLKWGGGGYPFNGNLYEVWNHLRVNTSGFAVPNPPTQDDHVATKQYVDASAGGLGVGQTWQDVSGSRLAQTSYQNTTGKPIMVTIKVNGGSSGSITFQVSSDGSSWLSVGTFVTSGRQENTVIIPPGWYYRSDSNGSIERWMELR